MKDKITKKACQELWAKNKYHVLSKSHKEYLKIREYLKSENLDFKFLDKKINDIKLMKESKKDFKNAMLHIWGYFKKEASQIEKEKFFKSLEDYMKDKISQKGLIEIIRKLLKKYPNKYLEKSILLSGDQDETMA